MVQKVLIIEDSKITSMYVSLFLKHDYDVLSAFNAKEGLDMVAEHRPDCIVSDLLMDEMDGFQLLEHAREKNLNIPIIIMSSDITESHKQQCLDLGAFAVLNKPLKGEELRKAVKDSLKAGKKDSCAH